MFVIYTLSQCICSRCLFVLSCVCWIYLMLPIKKTFIDSRHCAVDSTCSSDVQICLPINITLPPTTPFFFKNLSPSPSPGTMSKLEAMLVYTSALTGLLLVLLNVLYLKETTPLRHFSLLCVMLWMRVTRSTHLLGLSLKKVRTICKTWLITLRTYNGAQVRIIDWWTSFDRNLWRKAYWLFPAMLCQLYVA